MQICQESTCDAGGEPAGLSSAAAFSFLLCVLQQPSLCITDPSPGVVSPSSSAALSSPFCSSSFLPREPLVLVRASWVLFRHHCAFPLLRAQDPGRCGSEQIRWGRKAVLRERLLQMLEGGQPPPAWDLIITAKEFGTNERSDEVSQ